MTTRELRDSDPKASAVVYTQIPRPAAESVCTAKTCSVADVLESMDPLEGARQLMEPRISAIDPRLRLVGPAVTATNYPGDNSMIHAAAHVAGEGDVLVLSSGSVQGPQWGDVICTYALKKGISGVIVDGSIRDSNFMLDRNFPVWREHNSASHPTKSTGGAVNVPVVCGGVVVCPGDLIMADGDGVLVVPRLKLPSLLEAAQQRVEKENDMRERIEAGESLFDILQYDKVLRELGVEIIENAFEKR